MGCEGMLTVDQAVRIGLIVAAIGSVMVGILAYVHGWYAGKRWGYRYVDELVAKGALQATASIGGKEWNVSAL